MLIRVLLRVLSWLPLSWLYALGAGVGALVYRWDKKYAQVIRENAAVAGYTDEAFCIENAREAGRGGAELGYAWSPKAEQLLTQVKVIGWDEVMNVHAQGRGVVLLTPHMGAFEVLSLWIGRRAPFIAMYRAPRFLAFESVMLAGRERFGVQMATADIKGIRMMLRHLKTGGMVGLLPDQVPGGQGDGVIVPFFGKPALTMTLPAKLIKQTGAGLVVMFAKRVRERNSPHRFELYFEVVNESLPSVAEEAAVLINHHMERLIRMAPEQYLWSYKRYKRLPATHQPQEDA